MTGDTVLFVCLHGAAKSVVAAALFEQRAAARGLRARAAFAGLEPDPAVNPAVAAALRAEGLEVREGRPPTVTPGDLARARRVISLGCDVEPLAPGVAVERWDDVPAVSAGYGAARAVIAARVERLVEELSRADARTR